MGSSSEVAATITVRVYRVLASSIASRRSRVGDSFVPVPASPEGSTNTRESQSSSVTPSNVGASHTPSPVSPAPQIRTPRSHTPQVSSAGTPLAQLHAPQFINSPQPLSTIPQLSTGQLTTV